MHVKGTNYSDTTKPVNLKDSTADTGDYRICAAVYMMFSNRQTHLCPNNADLGLRGGEAAGTETEPAGLMALFCILTGMRATCM